MVLVLDHNPASPDPDAEPSRETRRANRADLRSILFAVVQDLSRSDDDQIRLRASLGGLRALAQLDNLDLRERRLEQHDKMIALAETHLTLQQQRAAAKGSGSPSQREGAGGRANSSAQPAPEPLNSQELAEFEEVLPHIPPARLRIPRLSNMWRNHLINARFWNAYWQGHKASEDSAQGLPRTPTRIPGTTPIRTRPSSEVPSSEIPNSKFSDSPAASPSPSDSDTSDFRLTPPLPPFPFPPPSEISDLKLPAAPPTSDPPTASHPP